MDPLAGRMDGHPANQLEDPGAIANISADPYDFKGALRKVVVVVVVVVMVVVMFVG